MIDHQPPSSNNLSGFIGIEFAATDEGLGVPYLDGETQLRSFAVGANDATRRESERGVTLAIGGTTGSV
jgi:hypothetical protein